MDGMYNSGGNGVRRRLMGRATLAAMALGVLAVVITGLILFFPKAKAPVTVAAGGPTTQPTRPTTAPTSMVLPAPVQALPAVPAKPVSAAKLAQGSTQAKKTIAKSRANSGKHVQVRSKAKTSKAMASRKNSLPVRVVSQG